ncbi:unnamed protein product [Macrosiphum euphorbiae]|uniref:Uncharacterized protein n=1 Tax=Macrosiphum euphorbiae TaxID=13131 RepID=A0AAV0Y9W2_9HEMI|nr:unnamed protein product [Macrosiphum euphorbiae]
MPQKTNIFPLSLTGTISKPVTRSALSSSQSDDILKAIAKLESSHQQLLKLNQQTSAQQSAQFEELKSNLGNISTQISDLKAENSNLRAELTALKSKIHLLESTPNTSSPQPPLLELIQELSERDKCSSNVIAYGFTESTSRTPQERIADDTKSVSDVFSNLSFKFPTDAKLFKLGKNVTNTPRPLKIILNSFCLRLVKLERVMLIFPPASNLFEINLNSNVSYYVNFTKS